MLFVATDGVITYIEDLYENDSLSGGKHKIMLKDNDLQTHYMSPLTSSGLRKRRMHSYNGQESTSEGISSLHNSPGSLLQTDFAYILSIRKSITTFLQDTYAWHVLSSQLINFVIIPFFSSALYHLQTNGRLARAFPFCSYFKHVSVAHETL